MTVAEAARVLLAARRLAQAEPSLDTVIALGDARLLFLETVLSTDVQPGEIATLMEENDLDVVARLLAASVALRCLRAARMASDGIKLANHAETVLRILDPLPVYPDTKFRD